MDAGVTILVFCAALGKAPMAIVFIVDWSFAGGSFRKHKRSMQLSRLAEPRSEESIALHNYSVQCDCVAREPVCEN